MKLTGDTARRVAVSPDTGRVISRVMFLATLLLVGLPIVYLGYGTFMSGSPGAQGAHLTLDNYVQTYANPAVYQRLWNTVILSFTVAALALVLGSVLAWIIARTNAPGAKALAPLFIVPMMISSLVSCLAWIALAAPNAGLINTLIVGLTGVRRVLDVYSFAGMVWVLVLHYAAFAFVSVYGALRSIDADLEEASYVMGVGPVRTALTMTLPLVTPTMASTFLLIFVFTSENFAVPLVLGTTSGYQTLMSQVYLAIAETPSEPGLAAAAGTMLLLIAVAGTAWQLRIMANAKKYVTVGGKGGRRRLTDLGPWKYVATAFVIFYFLLAVVVPYLSLVVGSLMRFVTSRITPNIWTFANYERMQEGSLLHLISNSLILSLGGGALAVAFYFFLSYLMSTSKTPLARATEYASIMPSVIPAIVLAIGILWAYISLPLPFYGTLGILFIALLTRYLGLGVRQSRSALVQISSELVDASRVAGHGPFSTFRNIVAPVLRPAVLSIWTLIFVHFFLDVGITVVLYTPQTMTIPVFLWSQLNSGQVTMAFAFAVLESTIVFTVLFVADRLFGTVRASIN
jgi:iron(III) transport system permease protein